jgi:hypothetical protein
LSHFRTALNKQVQGLSQKAEEIILSSRKSSTVSQYNSHLKNWIKFCDKYHLSPYNASVTQGINYLAECFEKGLGYSSINTA